MAAYPPKPLKLEGSETEVSSKISSKRREKLLNLKKREELKDVLIHKLKDKYKAHRKLNRENVDDGASERSAVIRYEVNRFLEKADVTENNLNRLERRIHKKAKNPRGNVEEDDVSVVSGVSHYTNHSVNSSSVKKKIPNLSAKLDTLPTVDENNELTVTGQSAAQLDASNKEDRSCEAPGTGMYDWSRLDEYAAYLHEQDTIRQKLQVMENQAKLRHDLDRQVHECRGRKVREKEEDSKYFDNQIIELEQWKVYEKKCEVERRSKAIKEKIDRDEQLQFNNERKETEDRVRKGEEHALVEKIGEEMAAEKRKIMARKEAQKRQMKLIMTENEEERAIKDEQKRIQMENDIKIMEEYHRMLDLQDKQRADELAARVERQKQLIEKMKENVIKQQSDKANEDQMRAERQKEESDARALELERAKKERLKQMQMHTQDYLWQQMREKDDRKASAYALKKLQAQILEADTKEFTEAEKRKMILRHSRNAEFKNELEAQINTKQMAQAGMRKYEMSDVEKVINKQLVDVVNKTLLERDQELESSVVPAMEE